MITIEKSDIHSAESFHLIEKLSAELASITGDSGKHNFTADSLGTEGALWVLAKNERGEAVGCGALRPLTAGIAELKRMYSDRSQAGIGNALLSFMESSARKLGYAEVWLETRHVNQRAIRFYQNKGYRLIENYGPYVGREEAACFAKTLNGQKAES